MATTNESSVLVNLKDLFEMEADRRVEEAAAKERARAEEAARADAERRAREEEIEAARVEERRRADEERARRDAALEERLRTLRDELAEVRAQREQMHLKVAEIAARPAPQPRRGSWMAGVMAAASLVAAITATAVAWPRDAEPLAQLTPAPVVTEAEPAPVAPTAPVIAEVEAPVEEAPALVATPEPAPRRPRTPPVRRIEREDSLSRQLDLGDDRSVLSDDFLREVGP